MSYVLGCRIRLYVVPYLKLLHHRMMRRQALDNVLSEIALFCISYVLHKVRDVQYRLNVLYSIEHTFNPETVSFS